MAYEQVDELDRMDPNEAALFMARYDPQYFRGLVRAFCKDTTEHQVIKSMRAWDIDPNHRGPITGQYGESSSSWTARNG